MKRVGKSMKKFLKKLGMCLMIFVIVGSIGLIIYNVIDRRTKKPKDYIYLADDLVYKDNRFSFDLKEENVPMLMIDENLLFSVATDDLTLAPWIDYGIWEEIFISVFELNALFASDHEYFSVPLWKLNNAKIWKITPDTINNFAYAESFYLFLQNDGSLYLATQNTMPDGKKFIKYLYRLDLGGIPSIYKDKMIYRYENGKQYLIFGTDNMSCRAWNFFDAAFESVYGNYELSDEKMILRTKEGPELVLVFDIKKDTLIFNQKESVLLDLDCIIPDGSVFIKEKESLYKDSSSNGNGYGVFWDNDDELDNLIMHFKEKNQLTLTIYPSKDIVGNRIPSEAIKTVHFELDENYDVAKLELDEKQNPYIRAERNTEKPIFHLFKISIDESGITLTDEAMGISYTEAFSAQVIVPN